LEKIAVRHCLGKKEKRERGSEFRVIITLSAEKKGLGGRRGVEESYLFSSRPFPMKRKKRRRKGGRADSSFPFFTFRLG